MKTQRVSSTDTVVSSPSDGVGEEGVPGAPAGRQRTKVREERERWTSERERERDKQGGFGEEGPVWY